MVALVYLVKCLAVNEKNRVRNPKSPKQKYSSIGQNIGVRFQRCEFESCYFYYKKQIITTTQNICVVKQHICNDIIREVKVPSYRCVDCSTKQGVGGAIKKEVLSNWLARRTVTPIY